MFAMLSLIHYESLAQSIYPPNSVTYLRTDAPPLPTGNNAVGGDATKNHQIIRNNTDDGFLQVMAGLSDVSGIMKWYIRLIAVDDGLHVLWSKELAVQESVGVTISTVPFAVCQNLNNDGFVIAGIVDNRLGSTLKLNHEGQGTQRPFFMEIDDFGNVTQLKVGDFIAPYTGVYNFVPFTICKRGNNQGYMAAGLMTTEVSVLNSSHRGYISKLDTAFDEIDGTMMSSTQFINAHPIVHKPERFDLITKIKPVPGEEDNYIICGALTENLFESSMFKIMLGSQFLFYGRNWDTLPSYEYAAGSSQGYIAKISENFALAPMWENKIYEESNHHCNFVDFTFDESENKIYVIGNTIAKSQTILSSQGNLFILDKSTGSTHHGGYLREHTNNTQSFWTNIYVSEDKYYACGFTLDIASLSTSKGMNPYVIAFDKTTNSAQPESFMIYGKNENYFLSHPFLEGFIQYQYSNTSYPNNNSYVIWDHNLKYSSALEMPYYYNAASIEMPSPPSWTPNAWIRNDEGEFTCLAVKKAEHISGAGAFFPNITEAYPTIWGYGSVFHSMLLPNPPGCGIVFEDMDKLFLPVFDLEGGHHTDWYPGSLIENTMKPHHDTITYYALGVECTYISIGEKIEKKDERIFDIGQLQPNHWRVKIAREFQQNIQSTINSEDISIKNNNTYNIEVYDLSGRRIIQEHNAAFPYDIRNLRKGMYLVYILSENGYSQTEKIVVFK